LIFGLEAASLNEAFCPSVKRGDCQMHDKTSESTQAVHKTNSRVSLKGRFRCDIHETSDIKVHRLVRQEYHGVFTKQI